MDLGRNFATRGDDDDDGDDGGCGGRGEGGHDDYNDRIDGTGVGAKGDLCSARGGGGDVGVSFPTHTSERPGPFNR